MQSGETAVLLTRLEKGYTKCAGYSFQSVKTLPNEMWSLKWTILPKSYAKKENSPDKDSEIF
jgi:hypothetical protein